MKIIDLRCVRPQHVTDHISAKPVAVGICGGGSAAYIGLHAAHQHIFHPFLPQNLIPSW